MKFAMEIRGGAALDAVLRTLPAKVQRQILKPALEEGAEIIAASARSHVHNVSGELAKSIKVKAARKHRKGQIRINVTTYASAKGAKRTSGSDYTGDRFYAPMVEFGHFAGPRNPKGVTRKLKRLLSRGRKYVPPHPFLRPAYEENKDAIVSAVGNRIASGIAQLATVSAEQRAPALAELSSGYVSDDASAAAYAAAEGG